MPTNTACPVPCIQLVLTPASRLSQAAQQRLRLRDARCASIQQDALRMSAGGRLHLDGDAARLDKEHLIRRGAFGKERLACLQPPPRHQRQQRRRNLPAIEAACKRHLRARAWQDSRSASTSHEAPALVKSFHNRARSLKSVYQLAEACTSTDREAREAFLLHGRYIRHARTCASSMLCLMTSRSVTRGGCSSHRPRCAATCRQTDRHPDIQNPKPKSTCMSATAPWSAFLCCSCYSRREFDC
jgi:hypothetical protein